MTIRASGISGVIGATKEGRRVEPSEWRWGYRCSYIDSSTGEVISTAWRVVLTDSPTNYQAASAQARREAWASVERYVSMQLIQSGNITVSCRRRGDIIGVP